MNKKTLFLILCILLVSVLTVAMIFFIPGDSTVIYESSNVRVSLLQDVNSDQSYQYEWMPMTEETAFTKNTIILTGTVTGVRESIIEYEYMGTEARDHITIFDVSVSQILQANTDTISDMSTVSIGIPYNSATYENGLPIIENGKEFLIFCYATADLENDLLELSRYVDCWLSTPKELLIEKIGDHYLADSYFGNYFPETMLVQSALNLTDGDVLTISDSSGHLLSAQIPEQSDIEEAPALISVLQSRVQNSSSAMQEQISSSYFIPCGTLEDMIVQIAENYS